MIGGVGQRMLSSVSKRMAGEFFSNVERAILSPAPTATAGSEVESAPGMPKVYVDPTAVPGRVSSQSDFLKGIAVGAGLVVLGVLLGRRRR
jgi:hypothetical protein